MSVITGLVFLIVEDIVVTIDFVYGIYIEVINESG